MHDFIIGTSAGLASALIIWISSLMWNKDAQNIVKIRAKRIQSYLQSISNDITWGVDDNKACYYDSLISKIPYIYNCIDESNQAISRLNFVLWGRKKYIKKQLEILEREMDDIMWEVEGAYKDDEIMRRLIYFKEKYQPTGKNKLLIRAEFLEKLVSTTNIDTLIVEVATDFDEEITDQNIKMLKDIY